MLMGSQTRAAPPTAVNHADPVRLRVASSTRPASAHSTPRLVTEPGAVDSAAFHQRYHVDMSLAYPR